jgi:hypothetical protein
MIDLSDSNYRFLAQPNAIALFGCTEIISGIELSGNSKFGVERKWLTFYCLDGLYCAVGIRSGTHFQFLFGCTRHGIGCFL